MKRSEKHVKDNVSVIENVISGATTTVGEQYELARCPKHNDHMLQLYCAFCEKPICDICKVTTHAPHVPEIKGYEELVMAAKRRRSFIQKLSSDRITHVIPNIKDKIVEITENKSKLIQRVTDVIRQYKGYAVNHRDKLKIPEKEWIEELMRQSSNFQSVMDEKILYLKSMLHEVQTALSNIQHELEASNYPEVLFAFGAWRFKLEFLLPPKWPRMEVNVTLKLDVIPDFGPLYFQDQRTRDKHCSVEFVTKIEEPLIYSRIYDAKLPIPAAILKDENAKISITSAEEVFVSFGEYIIVYSQDNRRTTNASYNIRLKRVVTVGENIIDLSCDRTGSHVFYLTQKSVNMLDVQNKMSKCFLLYAIPSAICVTKRGPVEIVIGFHDTGMICKYDAKGDLKMKVTLPIYRPRHMTLNVINDIIFSDNVSNVTISDANGTWKGMIGRAVKTGNGPLRPSGIACASQRHIYVIDSNVSTRLQIFDENGQFLQSAVFNNLNDAHVLTIDRTCDVWMGFKDGTIRIYRPGFHN